MLDSGADGRLSALFDGRAMALGRFGPETVKRCAEFATGLQLDAPGAAAGEKEMLELVRRLAGSGLLEYRLARAQSGADLVVIEPQMRFYAPRLAALDTGAALVLSRFAYLRRRGMDMVLESPRAGALFRLCDPGVAAMIASLSEPRTVAELAAARGFPGVELLALLVDCGILFAPAAGDKGLRASEGDDDLVLWDFQDLLFHTRSTNGRHANPTGGLYPYAHLFESLPAVRPAWPGQAIDLRPFDAPPSPFATLLRERRSTRIFDDRHPITLAELARMLDGAARILSIEHVQDDEDEGLVTEIARRPYPSGGASYELELYLAVDRCEGLARGFYHYDAARHALVAIEASEPQLAAMLAGGQHAMGAPATPQVLVTMAARFGRVSWKYSGFAYALVLKHVGIVMQNIYLMATEMELGACAIGIADIDLFAKMTGVAFHVEGPVGQIAIGRVGEEPAQDAD